MNDPNRPRSPGEPPLANPAAPAGGAFGSGSEPEATERGSHLGFVAHEIRNPLSTALWTAELLGRMKPEDRTSPRYDKLSNLCLRSVGRIRLLVEDHLLCERLDAGGYPVRIEPVVLSEAIEAAIGRGAGARVALTQALEPGLVARADRLLLERALDGLLGAAARDGAAVSLVARRLEGPAGDLEIRVQGAPPQTLEDLHKGAPSDQSGRTLAPAMARRVAAALGGALIVEAEAYLLRIPAA